MCGCGRKRGEVVTSAQALNAEQQRAAADAALARLEQEAVAEAQAYAQSAANAARNANS